MSKSSRQHRLPAKRGSHVAYKRSHDLVIEWYDFGDHAPYESANLLIFDQPGQQALGNALQIDIGSTDALAQAIARRFASYFEVERFAEKHAIPFTRETDFQP